MFGLENTRGYMKLNRAQLKACTDSGSFQRGENYFTCGYVKQLMEYQGKVIGKVQGTEEYSVKLWETNDQLEYECTCPIGREGVFCKHCVAVGLCWIDKQSNPDAGQKEVLSYADIRIWLSKQSKEALVEWLMEQVIANDRLYQKFLVKAANYLNKGVNITAYCQAIDQVVYTDRFIDYRAASNYATGIEEIVDTIAELIAEGHASEASEIIEYAFEKIEKAIGYVDDSNGEMGTILYKLEELHYQACTKAKPEPEALARRLFNWELNTAYDTFYGVAAKYAAVLGNKGLAVYQSFVEAEWAKVKTLAPGQKDPEFCGKRYRITHMMETMVKQSGDVEALVAIKQRDLSHAYNYLQIAEIYRKAKQYDKALAWAERGIVEFPAKPDFRLQDFLAEEYHRRGWHDKAMDQIWEQFKQSPYLSYYQKLKSHADVAKQWSIWREKALACMRKVVNTTKQKSSKNAWSCKSNQTELVRIFLWEKKYEEAWLEAKEGGCSRELWLELAKQREQDFPQDALTIYQAEIEPTLALTNNEAYHIVVGLLKKIQLLMQKLDKQEEFTSYLASLRVKHKPKRNFMKLLNEAGW